jgi:type IV secretory pathway TrbF-like protein
MLGLGTRKGAAGVATGNGNGKPSTAAAQRTLEDLGLYTESAHRFGAMHHNLAKQKHGWMAAALGMLAVCLVLAIGLVGLALSQRDHLYVLKVDELGQRQLIGPVATHAGAPDPTVVSEELKGFIFKLRTVSVDPHLHAQLVQQAWALTTPASAAYLDEYFRQPENNPGELQGKLTREVRNIMVSPMPQSASWKVQWTEIDRLIIAGVGRSRAWEAYLTLDYVPPQTPERFATNPFGIYVTALTWNPITP